MIQKIETSPLFQWTANAAAPIVIHSGGTNSGKTHSILQYLLALCVTLPGIVATVVGQDIPNLKKGAYRDAKHILNDTDAFNQNLSSHNKSEREFRFKNSSVMEFNSYDDAQDAKSGKRDHLFLNEANGIKKSIFDELEVRTTQQTFIDFNPTARFWAHDMQGRDDVKWFDSTYLNNPFLEPSIRKKIEAYEPTAENIKNKTANQWRWMVYGLGKVGRLEGLVFRDFEVSTDWPEKYKWRVFGLDFGFTNSPTALVEIRYAHGNLYWKQHMYQTGLTNPDISEELTRLGFSDDELIVADSAEPKSIEELKRKNWYIEAAVKGKDSVNQGIDAIKRYPIIVDAGSKDLIEEFSSYQWKEDKDGKSTNKPIDSFNHGIDAGRYGLSTRILNQREPLQAQMGNF
jgi:phage terminase large subunit